MEAILVIGDVRISGVEVLIHSIDRLMGDAEIVMVEDAWPTLITGRIEEKVPALLELRDYIIRDIELDSCVRLLLDKPPLNGVYRNRFTSAYAGVARERPRIRSNC
jgi:hypothetical protein